MKFYGKVELFRIFFLAPLFSFRFELSVMFCFIILCTILTASDFVPLPLQSLHSLSLFWFALLFIIFIKSLFMHSLTSFHPPLHLTALHQLFSLSKLTLLLRLIIIFFLNSSYQLFHSLFVSSFSSSFPLSTLQFHSHSSLYSSYY